MTTLHKLKQLHTIIGNALDVLDSAYQGRGLDYPALDKPYMKDEAERLAHTPPLVAASNRIVAACDQLIASVRSPYNSVCDAALSFLIPACLRLSEQTHVVEILREAGETGMHVDDIATKTNIDSSRLTHSIRLLATHHIFQEITPNVFKNNRISSYIDTEKTCVEILSYPGKKYEGTEGMAAFVACAGDEFFKSAAFLTEATTNPKFSHSRLPTQTAFNIAWNTDKTFFKFLQQKENLHRSQRFLTALKATDGFSKPEAIIEGFPWSTLPPGSVVVDVGGGMGTSMMVVHSHFPRLTCIVQDLSSVCALGEKQLPADARPTAGSGGVQFQAHDFFTSQPVTDASVFFLRTVLHDWSDFYAIQILHRLRQAATPTTKLVIAEYLLAYACADNNKEGNHITATPMTTTSPPPPLLANLGKANALFYAVDMNMHVMFNAQERTISQLIDLTCQGGWKITEIRRLEEGLFGHMIAVPSDLPKDLSHLSA